MRILHVGPMYAPAVGGGELHLQALSEGLAARGHDVTVFTANVRNGHEAWNSRFGGLPGEETLNGVRVVRFHPDGGRAKQTLDQLLALPGGWRGANALLSPAGRELLLQGPRTIQMIPAIRRHRADVVVTFNWYWPQAYHAHLAGSLARIRLVGVPLFHTMQTWCARPVYDGMLARCRAVAVSTTHEQEYALRRGARIAEVVGVGVTPGPSSVGAGRAIRERYDLGSHPVVGYIGRQEENKGLVALIDAARIVWAEAPDMRLLLAGHGEPDRFVRAALERLTASERARIVNVGAFPDDEKAAIFDAIDVFAMPSKEESFGIAYLEAWLAGKPVIGARIGSTSCVIRDGEDGLLADPDDPADIAKAMVRLLGDAALRQQMAGAGRAQTLAHHTWDHVLDRAEALYRRVAS